MLVIPAKAGIHGRGVVVRKTPFVRCGILVGAAYSRELLAFRDRADLRPLPRPSVFFFAGPKKKSPKRKGLPEHSSPATGCAFGIFVLALVARSENGGHPCPPPSGFGERAGLQA